MRYYNISTLPIIQPLEGIPCSQLGVGELAEVLEGDYAGTILLCMYNGLVSLTDPQKTWMGRGSDLLPSFRVKKLAYATIVRLVVT